MWLWSNFFVVFVCYILFMNLVKFWYYWVCCYMIFFYVILFCMFLLIFYLSSFLNFLVEVNEWLLIRKVRYMKFWCFSGLLIERWDCLCMFFYLFCFYWKDEWCIWRIFFGWSEEFFIFILLLILIIWGWLNEVMMKGILICEGFI